MQENKNETKLTCMCVLAYFGILFFLPLVFCKGSTKGKFHANQGAVLLFTTVVLNVILPVLGLFLNGIVQNVLYTVVELSCLALAVLGILHVCNDVLRPLPFIGKIVLIK